MTRDPAVLAVVSPNLTPEILQVVYEKTTCKSGKLKDWALAPGTEEGVNFLSVVHRMTLAGSVGGEPRDVQVILKGLPPNLCYRKSFKSADFFRNEIAFYSTVVRAFEDFLKSKKAPELLNVPKRIPFLPNDFIVLEDITTKGYDHLTGKHDPWSVEDIRKVLKGLAQFHAISLAFNAQDPAGFSRATEDLEEMVFTEDKWQWYSKHYANMTKVAKAAMTQHYPNTPEEKKYNALTAGEHLQNCVRICNRKRDSPSVVVHGDCWPFNCMARVSNSGDSDVVFFDFQLTRKANVVLDLSYFIYASTDKETRDEHFWALLKYYYSELGKVVSRLGSDVDDIYPEDLFMKDVKEQFVLGMCYAVDIITMIASAGNPLADLDSFTEDRAVDISEIWKFSGDLPAETTNRLADVIAHAIQEGFF